VIAGLCTVELFVAMSTEGARELGVVWNPVPLLEQVNTPSGVAIPGGVSCLYPLAGRDGGWKLEG
jgi:hypothetical protein